MSLTRVAVLRGGPSGEYEVSLQSGSAVLANLPGSYKGIDILIDKNGRWHRAGVPVAQHQALKDADVVFNALHGEYGEDGKLQQELEHLHIPYTGSGPLSAAIAMSKSLSKEHYRRAGLRVPRGLTLSVGEDLDRKALEIFRSLALPVVVKPENAGSSLGVTIVRMFDDLKGAIAKAFAYAKRALIEEFIPGREATCGVVEGFRGREVYALFPIEIVPQESEFFDYDAKYKGRSLELCPSGFPHETKQEIERLAVAAHQALGLRDYSRSDFIVSPRGIYLLETNTLPGLTRESLLPKALAAGGSSLSEFLDHTITRALNRRERHYVEQ